MKLNPKEPIILSKGINIFFYFVCLFTSGLYDAMRTVCCCLRQQNGPRAGRHVVQPTTMNQSKKPQHLNLYGSVSHQTVNMGVKPVLQPFS